MLVCQQTVPVMAPLPSADLLCPLPCLLSALFRRHLRADCFGAGGCRGKPGQCPGHVTAKPALPADPAHAADGPEGRHLEAPGLGHLCPQQSKCHEKPRDHVGFSPTCALPWHLLPYSVSRKWSLAANVPSCPLLWRSKGELLCPGGYIVLSLLPSHQGSPRPVTN